MSVPFTICICTHNRAEHLERCLQSLVDHMPTGTSVPVMVVDNASTDNTAEVARSFAGRLALVYRHAPEPGLSRARNVGWRDCATEYIVYLDDDAMASPEWIPAIVEGIERHRPDFFGGAYTPFYLVDKPAWFKDAYGSMHLEKKEGPLAHDQFLSGGNMGWRRDLLESLGGFPEDLGMIGRQMGLGEESHLQQRLRREQPSCRGVFLERMRMLHLVPTEKLAIGYWVRRAWKHGCQDVRIHGELQPLTIRWIVREMALIPWMILRAMARSRSLHPHWQNFVFECCWRRFTFWGRVYSSLFPGRS